MEEKGIVCPCCSAVFLVENNSITDTKLQLSLDLNDRGVQDTNQLERFRQVAPEVYNHEGEA